MSLLNELRDDAGKTGARIETQEVKDLTGIFNRMFYAEKDIEEETKFVKTVMTRGLETTERSGFHASDAIAGHKKYCDRAAILSIHYKQLQGEAVKVGLKRIFEEGNAIHEKVQRLFIRAGYAKASTLDRTRFDPSYHCRYTPDIACKIPEFFNGVMIGEIKSVNTHKFKTMTEHYEARDQLLLYMYLCIREAQKKKKWNGVDYTKGFVWAEDKNTQDFAVFIYNYKEDRHHISKIIDRLNDVNTYNNLFVEKRQLAKKHPECTGYDSKQAQTCNLRDVCYNKGKGRVKL